MHVINVAILTCFQCVFFIWQCCIHIWQEGMLKSTCRSLTCHNQTNANHKLCQSPARLNISKCGHDYVRLLVRLMSMRLGRSLEFWVNLFKMWLQWFVKNLNWHINLFLFCENVMSVQTSRQNTNFICEWLYLTMPCCIIASLINIIVSKKKSILAITQNLQKWPKKVQ